MRLTAGFLAATLALGGCATTNPGSGTVVGGFAGQPTRPASAPAGQAIINAMAGGLIGGNVGAGLSGSERVQALEAEYRALEYAPVGEAVVWGKKSSGRYGEVVAATPYRVGSQDCRQYTHTVHVGSTPNVARGTACRNADGSWTPLT
jgi:surface antigen